MTSTQAQKETKMNEITNTRTAIKNADHLAEAGRMNYAEMAVTTFTDRRGNDAKLVSGQIGTPIASITVGNEIRSRSLRNNRAGRSFGGGSSYFWFLVIKIIDWD